MINYVIDANVALKWYIPETLTSDAVALLENLKEEKYRFFAPDLILPEIGNVLWKKYMKKELSSEEVRFITETILKTLPIKLYTSKNYLPAAMEIAMKFQRTLYDSLYLALAITEKFCLITADKRMVNSLKETAYSKNIIYLGDYLKD